MNKSVALFVLGLACLWQSGALAQLSVLYSGGFAAPYREVMPEFEKSTGLTVTSTQAPSQGAGSNTIPALIEGGAVVDVVIMTREGLDELTADGRTLRETVVDLARAPLGVAIRLGTPRPDLTTVEGFKQAVLRARSINYVSTTGIYMTDRLFPLLGIAGEAARKRTEDSVGDLPKTSVDLVLRPVSEIVSVPGFEFVGPVPQEIQYVTTFSAAVVTNSKQLDAGKRLIAFLASRSRDAAKRVGMQPVD
jgi:molybdate transport system substrate-binding protein